MNFADFLLLFADIPVYYCIASNIEDSVHRKYFPSILNVRSDGDRLIFLKSSLSRK